VGSAARGGSAAECVKDPALPEACVALRKMFFECKRGQLVSSEPLQVFRHNRKGAGVVLVEFRRMLLADRR